MYMLYIYKYLFSLCLPRTKMLGKVHLLLDSVLAVDQLPTHSTSAWFEPGGSASYEILCIEGVSITP